MLFYLWFEERFELQTIQDDILSKYVPAYINIFYCFGGVVFTSFIVQVSSGFTLRIYYRSSVLDALESVSVINSQTHLGWLIRTFHRWSSSIMVIFVRLHIIRVYLTGSFTKPREITWITGLLSSLVASSFGITGYSLPWDQVAYWASKIVTSTPQIFDTTIQDLGTTIVNTFRGNLTVKQNTLSLFYMIHTFVLPSISLVLLLFHFLLIRKQGISGPL